MGMGMLKRWIACLLLLGIGSVVFAQKGAELPAAQPVPRGPVPTASISPEAAIVEALQTILKGYRFNKRLLTGSEQDHLLLFNRGKYDVALVGWTTSGLSDRVALAPAIPMQFNAYTYTGTLLGTVNTIDSEIGLVLGVEPIVLMPQQPNALLVMAAAAETVNPVIRVRGPQTLELTCEFSNPLNEVAVMAVPDMGKTIAVKPGGSQTIHKSVKVGRSAEPIRTSIGAMGIRQPVTIIVENPLELTVHPEEPRMLVLNLVNSGGEPFKGDVLFALGEGGEPFRLPLEFRSGQRTQSLRIPLGEPLPLPSLLRVSVEQVVPQPIRRTYVLAESGQLQFVPAADFSQTDNKQVPTGYTLTMEGGASAMIRGGEAQTAVPWPNQGSLDFAYDFGSRAPRQERRNEGLLSVEPVNADWARVHGTPSQVGLWLFGDGQGNLLSMSWRDATGKVHASYPRPVDWKGWRYITIDLPKGMVPPLQWDSLLRLEPAEDGSVPSRHGSLLANGYCFIYGANYSLSGYESETPNYEEAIAPAAPIEVIESGVIRGEPVRRAPASK